MLLGNSGKFWEAFRFAVCVCVLQILCVVTCLLHRAVEGPVADDRMSSFPPACCCWQGTCREGLRRRGGQRRGRGPGGARSWPCGAAQRSCAGSGPLPRAGAQLPVDGVLLLGGVADAAAAGL